MKERTLEADYDTVIKKISRLQRIADELQKIMDDELFVNVAGNKFSHDIDRDYMEISHWLFENDIVAELKSYTFEGEQLLIIVTGYRFKSIEDAAAFKLKWT